MYKDDKTMISLENNMARTCIWKRYDYEVLRNDMIMIRHVNDNGMKYIIIRDM